MERAIVLIVQDPGWCGTIPQWPLLLQNKREVKLVRNSGKNSMRRGHHIQMNSRIEGMKLQNFWDWHRKLTGLLSGQEEPVK